jgi:hypothetical protein
VRVRQEDPTEVWDEAAVQSQFPSSVSVLFLGGRVAKSMEHAGDWLAWISFSACQSLLI